MQLSEPKSGEFANSFAIVNKSYKKDLPWAIVLYQSWCKFAEPKCPFYVIVPNSDLNEFVDAFHQGVDSGKFSQIPHLLAEEALFAAHNIAIPSEFTGWHTQQIVKLCFSKSNFAKSYMTVDSSIIFSKKFDYRIFIENGHAATSALPIIKRDFFTSLHTSGEKGWLNESIVNISASFNQICNFMENKTAATNVYISCTGIFESLTCRELELFAISKGVDGYVGLIKIAPYEFAWYGEFVYSQRGGLFFPLGPYFMTLAHSPQHAEEIRRGDFCIHPDHLGVMFQPPASELCSPGEAFNELIDEQVI